MRQNERFEDSPGRERDGSGPGFSVEFGQQTMEAIRVLGIETPGKHGLAHNVGSGRRGTPRRR